MHPNHRQVCMHDQFNMHQLIMSYYKIMGSRIGNHIRVRRTWAPRGSGLVSGFDGRTTRRDQSRTTEVDLVASEKKNLVGVGVTSDSSWSVSILSLRRSCRVRAIESVLA